MADGRSRHSGMRRNGVFLLAKGIQLKSNTGSAERYQSRCAGKQLAGHDGEDIAVLVSESLYNVGFPLAATGHVESRRDTEFNRQSERKQDCILCVKFDAVSRMEQFDNQSVGGRDVMSETSTDTDRSLDRFLGIISRPGGIKQPSNKQAHTAYEPDSRQLRQPPVDRH